MAKREQVVAEELKNQEEPRRDKKNQKPILRNPRN